MGGRIGRGLGIGVTLCAGEGKNLRADNGGRPMHFAKVRERELDRDLSLEPFSVGGVVSVHPRSDRASATHDKIHGLGLITRNPAGSLGHCGEA
jgi:hypothetical protein